jgi:hypothetical protein
MHERKAALILALVLTGAIPPHAAAADVGDAAVKAREGDVDHWIEYYRQSRPAAAVPPEPAARRGEDKPSKPKSRDAQPQADKEGK